MAVLTWALAAVLVGVAAVSNGAAPSCWSLAASDRTCSTVRLLTGAPSFVKEKVLQVLCKTGKRHVRQKQNERQFAVVNLHRDDFSEKVRWQAGDARNVTADEDWEVDEGTRVPAGEGVDPRYATSYYHWYRLGLPSWPLLNQALNNTTRSSSCNPFCKSRKPDWPNYAFATPLYLVPYETRNYRNPYISIGKIFSLLKNSQQKVFAEPLQFYQYVREFYQSRADSIRKHPESLRNWLTPLLDLSLPNMLASFKARQHSRAPKKSKISRCPDQLYVFFLQEPCQDDLLKLQEDLTHPLTVDGCSTHTSVVIGCSACLSPSAC